VDTKLSAHNLNNTLTCISR